MVHGHWGLKIAVKIGAPTWSGWRGLRRIAEADLVSKARVAMPVPDTRRYATQCVSWMMGGGRNSTARRQLCSMKREAWNMKHESMKSAEDDPAVFSRPGVAQSTWTPFTTEEVNVKCGRGAIGHLVTVYS